MMFVLSVLVIFVLLVASELWWRRRGVHGEFSRKFVHITVGSFVAFWPYLLSSTQIKLLSAAFLVVVVISKRLKIFSVIHSVQRPTWGEFWFAAVVGLLAFLPHHPHIYTAALLEMSLADGLAAVVGTRYGTQRQRYLIFGSTKSVIGTTTFFITSLLILAGYVYWTPHALAWPLVVPIALAATVLENIAVRGLDNLVVPVTIAGLLFLVAR